MSWRDTWAAQQIKKQWIQLVFLATVATVSLASFLLFGHPIRRPKQKKFLQDETRNDKKVVASTSAVNDTTASSSSAVTQEEAAAPAPAKVLSKEEEALKLKQAEYEDLGKRATEAFKAGNFDESVKLFTAAFEVGTTLDNVYKQQQVLLANRSAVHEKKGSVEDSLKDCAKLLSLDPTHKKANERRKRLMDSLMQQEKYQDVLNELMVSFLLELESIKQQMMLGLLKEPPQLSPPEELDMIAKKASKQLIESLKSREVPKVVPSYYTVKQVLNILPGYQNLRKTANSRRPLQEVTEELKTTEEVPQKIQLLLERALTNLLEAKFKETDVDLIQALEILDANPSVELPEGLQVELLSWAGTFLHLKHELEKAKQVLERCCNLEGSKAEIWLKRACLCLDRGEFDEARQLFDTAKELEPESPFVYIWRCQQHMMGKPSEASLENAEQELNACLQVDQDNAIALVRLMNIKIQKNAIEEATDAIERAKRAAPRSADVAAAYAEFLLMKGEMDNAMNQLEKAIRLEPSNPLPFINKALISWQQEDHRGAREILEHVIAMDPLYQPAYAFLANLEFRMAPTFEETARGFELIDKGIAICRSPEDLEEMCQIKVLATAKIEAARKLEWSSSRAMEI